MNFSKNIRNYPIIFVILLFTSILFFALCQETCSFDHNKKDCKIAYKLKQQIELKEWISDTLPVKEEKYDRYGLLLLQQTYKENRWQRHIDEYFFQARYLAELQNRSKVAREELREKHIEALSQRSIEFALEDTLRIESDVANSDLTLLWFDGMPIPHHLLYLPTVIPNMPKNTVKKGESWKGVIELEVKGFEFPVHYTITMLKQDKENATISVTIDTKQKPSSSGNEVQGFLVPEGQWTIFFSKELGAPIWAEGFCSMSLRMKFRSMDGKDIDVIALSNKNTFRYEKITATFDEVSFYPKNLNFTENNK